jgi:hypothetical protein
VEVPKGTWYLGRVEADDPLLYEADDLTTHGVIVGMTGSGKTGLGIIALEESLLSGIPAIVIDPKGDMGNLALVFPELEPADFAPWIDEATAAREGFDPAVGAAAVAERWRAGLAASGIGPERMRALAEGAEVTIYTPGSTAGVPLDMLGSLSAPADLTDTEGLRDEAKSLTSSILLMVGLDTDPVSSPEHILVATIIESAWVAGESIDLPGLIGRVLRPPMRRLGVFEVDQFIPAKDRTALAMRLNGLVASPSFTTWTTGEPIDIDRLTRTPDGRPRAAVLSLAHLGDDERQLVVTLVLARLVSWMRRQPGTSALRLLVYMDEMFGFAPPTAQPPSKGPILTLLKQARAHGVGLLLATQNPVDLDYKALANAGTWMIGRLQTERDKARILEGMRSATGDSDPTTLGDTITGLERRHFMLHSAKGGRAPVFATRWAMSYLSGPMSRPQLELLTGARPEPTTPRRPGDQAPSPDLADDETLVAPPVAGSSFHLDPAAPWLESVGGDPAGTRLVAGVATRVTLTFSDRAASIDHTEEWEAVAVPAPRPGDAAWVPVDHDDRDLTEHAPAGARYVLPDAPVSDAGYLRDLRTSLVDHLVASEGLPIWVNHHLGLFSRVDEDRDAFGSRCAQEAALRADGELAKLRDRFDTRRRTAQERLRTAEARATEVGAAATAARQEEFLGAAGDLLGSLLGGRSNSTALRRMARSRANSTKATGRGAAAEAQVEARMQDLLALEDELERQVLDITDAWADKATDISTSELKLVKSRVRVDDLVVIWVPFA